MKKVIIIFAFCVLLPGSFFFLFLSKNDSKANLTEGLAIEQHYSSQAVDLPDYSELQSILNIDNIQERRHQLEQFFARYIPENPDHALDMIASLKTERHRQLSYEVALSLWSNTDLQAFIDWLETRQPDPDLDSALVYLLERGSDDLESSLLYAGKLFNHNLQNNTVVKLIDLWILKQPESIVLWTLDQGGTGDEWLSLAFKLLTLDSLTTAINSLSVMEEGTGAQLHIAIQTIIDYYEIGLVDKATLIAMQSLTPYEIREELIGALLPLLIQEAFIDGAILTLDDLNTLLGSLLPGDVRDSYHELVALNWAIKDPQEAAEYAESLTGETRNLAINAVVESWLQTDLESADQWLSTLDGNLDLAANTLGRGSAQLGNIQIANNWINYIENEQIRTEAIVDVVNGWYQESPESGVYHLVYQKSLTNQQKLDLLHEIYPGEVFITPMDALDDIGRLEGLQSGF